MAVENRKALSPSPSKTGRGKGLLESPMMRQTRSNRAHTPPSSSRPPRPPVAMDNASARSTSPTLNTRAATTTTTTTTNATIGSNRSASSASSSSSSSSSKKRSRNDEDIDEDDDDNESTTVASNATTSTSSCYPASLIHTKSELEFADVSSSSIHSSPLITDSMRRAQEEAEKEVAERRAQEDLLHKNNPLVVPTLLRASGLTAEEAPHLADTQDKESSAQPIPRFEDGDNSTTTSANNGNGNRNNRRTTQLDTLLQKASHFNNFILGKLEHGSGTILSAAGGGASQGEGKASSKKKRKKGASSSTSSSGSITDVSRDREEAMADAARKMAQGKEGELTMQQPKSLTGGTLKPYQLEGLNWLSSLWMNGLNGILADEMGLGKTIQVIALFALLREKGISGPFLVVAPLATLPNWSLEIRKWLPSASVLLYHGDVKERESFREEQMPLSREKQTSSLFPIIVTSYEIASIDRKYLMRYQWRWLIVDEGQRIKNRNGKLFNELKEIPSESRLLLSGTPIQNSLEELWTLLNFCQPDIFDDLDIFRSWFGFQNIGKDTTVDDILDEEHRERVVTKLHEVLRPFLLRRLKRDVNIELPDKKELVVYANMSEIQHDYYRLAQEGHLRDALVSQGVPNADMIRQTNVQMLLRKTCNHPFLIGEPLDRKTEEPIGVANPKILIEASGKLKLMDRMLKKLHAQHHRVLIFSQMTEMMTVMEDYLKYRRWKYCRIDGGTKMDERQQQIEQYNQDKSIFVFLLSTRAGGLGINLAGADTVIIYDSDWNPHRDAQAQDRAHRIGQTVDVAVYRLLTVGSVEIDMMEAQISKKKLERLSIAGGDFRKAGRRSRGIMTMDGLRALLKDDVQNIQRKADFTEISEHDIDEEELNMILDRKAMFEGDKLPVEGKMYDVVQIVGSDLLSGM